MSTHETSPLNNEPIHYFRNRSPKLPRGMIEKMVGRPGPAPNTKIALIGGADLA